MMRSACIHISGKLSYRDQLIAIWTRDPRTTIEEARRITGAPSATAKKVRADLSARGVLGPGKDRGP